MTPYLTAVPQAIHLCPRCYEPVESGGSLYCSSCDAALVFARYMEKAFNAPLPPPAARPVDLYQSIPRLRGGDSRRGAWLIRFSDRARRILVFAALAAYTLGVWALVIGFLAHKVAH